MGNPSDKNIFWSNGQRWTSWRGEISKKCRLNHQVVSKTDWFNVIFATSVQYYFSATATTGTIARLHNTPPSRKETSISTNAWKNHQSAQLVVLLVCVDQIGVQFGWHSPQSRGGLWTWNVRNHPSFHLCSWFILSLRAPIKHQDAK